MLSDGPALCQQAVCPRCAAMRGWHGRMQRVQTSLACDLSRNAIQTCSPQFSCRSTNRFEFVPGGQAYESRGPKVGLAPKAITRATPNGRIRARRSFRCRRHWDSWFVISGDQCSTFRIGTSDLITFVNSIRFSTHACQIRGSIQQLILQRRKHQFWCALILHCALIGFRHWFPIERRTSADPSLHKLHKQAIVRPQRLQVHAL